MFARASFCVLLCTLSTALRTLAQCPSDQSLCSVPDALDLNKYGNDTVENEMSVVMNMTVLPRESSKDRSRSDTRLNEFVADLSKRQDTSTTPSLCCKASPIQCRHVEDVPYCYDPSTTEFTFVDGSHGYIANKTFYNANWTILKVPHGAMFHPNRTFVNFEVNNSTVTGAAAKASKVVSTTNVMGIAAAVVGLQIAILVT